MRSNLCKLIMTWLRRNVNFFLIITIIILPLNCVDNTSILNPVNTSMSKLKDLTTSKLPECIKKLIQTVDKEVCESQVVLKKLRVTINGRNQCKIVCNEQNKTKITNLNTLFKMVVIMMKDHYQMTRINDEMIKGKFRPHIIARCQQLDKNKQEMICQCPTPLQLYGSNATKRIINKAIRNLNKIDTKDLNKISTKDLIKVNTKSTKESNPKSVEEDKTYMKTVQEYFSSFLPESCKHYLSRRSRNSDNNSSARGSRNNIIRRTQSTRPVRNTRINRNEFYDTTDDNESLYSDQNVNHRHRQQQRQRTRYNSAQSYHGDETESVINDERTDTEEQSINRGDRVMHYIRLFVNKTNLPVFLLTVLFIITIIPTTFIQVGCLALMWKCFEK